MDDEKEKEKEKEEEEVVVVEKKTKLNEEREHLIITIMKYQNSKRFGEYLQTNMNLQYAEEGLRKRSSKQLEDILMKINLRLDSRGIDQIFEQFANMSAVLIEKSVDPFYECQGYAKNLLSNPSFHDAVERYRIELKLPKVPPLVQISYVMTSTLITTHEINKLKESNISQNKKPDIII